MRQKERPGKKLNNLYKGNLFHMILAVGLQKSLTKCEALKG
jgi:hypothetical protein